MLDRNRPRAPDFLSSRETYEKYERPHSREFDSIPIPITSQPVTYFDEYRVTRTTPTFPEDVTQPLPQLPQPVISEYEVQPPGKGKIPFSRIIAAAIGIPLFIMIVLFVAIWFQELGFI